MQGKTSTLSVSLLTLALIGASLLSCRGPKKSSSPAAAGAQTANVETPDDKILLDLENAEPGLQILLSEGKSQGAVLVRSSVAAGRQLAPSQVKVLLSRLPKLLTKKGDKTDFAFRERSLPPPRTGKSVNHAFPPKPSLAKKPSVSGTLEVVRFAPEGAVPLAPHLSVTFSQPMVAVTSHADSIKSVPVSLSPQPEGQWRWVGTKTLLFDPDVRFPMATSYEVKIAKGTKSANGEVLASAKNFSFVTPTLTMKQSFPRYQPQPLTPIIFASFDQRIDPAAVLAKVELRAKGKRAKVRMATEEEIQDDKAVFGMVEAQRKRDNGTGLYACGALAQGGQHLGDHW